MTITRHEQTDEWRVEIGGKTYWAKRFSVDGSESSWSVQVVRPAPNGLSESVSIRDVDSDGKVHKKVVAYVKEQIATTRTIDAKGRQLIWAKIPQAACVD